MYNLICERCGKPFQSKKHSSRFCCRECYNNYIEECKRTGSLKGKKQNKVEVVCAECGKHEFVPPSRAKKYVCCSKECLSKYNSRTRSEKIELTCPICGKKYYSKKSALAHHRTCGSPSCKSEWFSRTRSGSKNSRYRSIENRIKSGDLGNKDIYRHIVKEHFGLGALKNLPKNYDIHHKDANHNNNDVHNLVLLPRSAHMLVHRHFGNILIAALHTGKITREQFFDLCNEDQKKFYEQIIDLDITKQVVVKQGELLESLDEDNQQPSIYRNIYVGSETNDQVLTVNAEDGNVDTSALPLKKGEDIVQTARITNKNEGADI